VIFMFLDTVPVGAGTVSVAFTDRRLDLGDLAAADVRDAGLAEVATATGATPYLMHQVHGIAVHEVEDPAEPTPDADALVTVRPGIALLARVADCVPVLLVADTGVVGAVHAGREGVRRGVVTVAVERMRRLGSEVVRGWIGPHVCGRCYEVPEDLREQVAAAVPATRATTSWGTPALDLGAGVRAQLDRRDGTAAGRMAGVVWRAAP